MKRQSLQDRIFIEWWIVSPSQSFDPSSRLKRCCSNLFSLYFCAILLQVFVDVVYPLHITLINTFIAIHSKNPKVKRSPTELNTY